MQKENHKKRNIKPSNNYFKGIKSLIDEKNYRAKEIPVKNCFKKDNDTIIAIEKSYFFDMKISIFRY